MLRMLIAIGLTLIVTQSAVHATSIYLHRGLAHRALTLHPIADFFFRLILWITTGQDRRQWVAVHRKHHAFTDTEKDPHSPLVHGFWKIQLGNVYYYIREARNAETVARWAKDIPSDWWDRRIFSKGALGGILGLILAMWILGPVWGIFVVVAHLVLYVFVLAPSINGLGHWWGRRNFAGNSATNIRLLAWLTGGESLHNNHHAYPSSPKFSVLRSEVDPSWLVIKVLTAVGLVTLIGEPVPKPS